MAIFTLDSTDTISWNESDSSFRPPVVFNLSDTVYFRDDGYGADPPSALGGMRYAGSDSVGWQESSIFQPLGFHGSDSFHIGDSGVVEFPKEFIGNDSLNWSEDNEFRLSVRNFDVTENVAFTEIPTQTISGYQVGISDTITWAEFFTIVLLPGPNNRSATDNITFTDSGTLNVSKGGKDNIQFFDIGCMCYVYKRSHHDYWTLNDHGSMWINDRRITVPGTLPGGSGNIFKATIRFNKVENVKFIDQGYRVNDLGIPIVDPSCCAPGEEIISLGWAALDGWAALGDWEGLGE